MWCVRAPFSQCFPDLFPPQVTLRDQILQLVLLLKSIKLTLQDVILPTRNFPAVVNVFLNTLYLLRTGNALIVKEVVALLQASKRRDCLPSFRLVLHREG